MGAAATAREMDNTALYKQDLDRIAGAVFLPFVNKMMGGRSPVADNLIGMIAAAQGYQSGKPTKECRRSIEKGLTALFWQEMTLIWSTNLYKVVFDVTF